MNPSHDWAAPRTTHAFTGYVQDGEKPVGLVVRFLTHTPIPLSEDDRIDSNQKRVTGTILGFPKLGFGSAPYAKKSSKPGKGNKGKDKPSPKGRPLLEAHSFHESTRVSFASLAAFAERCLDVTRDG
jgi:hypothetical protein